MDTPTANNRWPRLVLALDVRPEHLETVKAMLTIVRNGLDDFSHGQSLLAGYFGPELVDDLDADVVEAVMMAYEEQDDDEPAVKRAKVIRSGGRAFARVTVSGSGQPDFLDAIAGLGAVVKANFAK